MKHGFGFLLALSALTLTACKSEKRIAHYSDMYQQQTQVVYVAPINDYSSRRAVREQDDSVYNASLNAATMQLYLTAFPPLTNHGYYVPGPLMSAQIASAETRTGKQMRTDSIGDLHASLGIDAVLFIDLLNWSSTNNTWSVEVNYLLRSTHTGTEMFRAHVKATKILPTDYRGNPRPLKEDEAFAQQYGCDLETAQRCRLVEILNQYVLKDLPSGKRARQYEAERYSKPHPQQFNLRILYNGSVEMLKDDQI